MTIVIALFLCEYKFAFDLLNKFSVFYKTSPGDRDIQSTVLRVRSWFGTNMSVKFLYAVVLIKVQLEFTRSQQSFTDSMLAFSRHIGLLRSVRFLVVRDKHLCLQDVTCKRPICSRNRLVAKVSSQQHRNIDIPTDGSVQPNTPAKSAIFNEYFSTGLGVVILRKGKARLFRELRHTMVYSGAIAETLAGNGTTVIELSAAVVVVDNNYKPIGLGLYNPKSMFRVRLLQILNDEILPKKPWCVEESISSLLDHAISKRLAVGLPNAHTDSYRIVNGDGDGLSGLFVDRFGHAAVIASCAAWCQHYRSSVEKAVRIALAPYGITDIVWRSHAERLRQDGLLLPTDEGSADANLSPGSVAKEVILSAREGDVLFQLPRSMLQSGQKTGHYADQREARAYIRQLISARGDSPRVLDLFCYTGGFALNAALANSGVKVVAVDSSETALDMARRNAELNGVGDRISFVKSDVPKFARTTRETSADRFNVIIVDPPKFAPSSRALTKALSKYRRVNQSAIGLIVPHGILVSCSCSAAVSQRREVFIDTIRAAAAAENREISLMCSFGASADHPVNVGMLETEYLTVCVFSVR